MVRTASWCWRISPTPTLRLPAIGWSWSMYSKRRSNRAPGSVHCPCTFQLVLIMQNAEPQEAPASAAALIASAANSNRFIVPSFESATTRDARRRAARVLLRHQEKAGGALGKLGGNRGEGFVTASAPATASATRGGRNETVQRTTRAGFAPASDSAKWSQVQTWPDPGGQMGDQACRSGIKEPVPPCVLVAPS